MEQLIQQFERPLADGRGDEYVVQVYARSRPGDTWQGYVVFRRRRDGESFTTGTETTQPSADAIAYWASGLTDTFFDGAFRRATEPKVAPLPVAPIVVQPAPVVDEGVDRNVRAARLAELEEQILGVFRGRGRTSMLTSELFDSLPHENTDVIRALEDLEKQRRLLVRRTEEGNDWLFLTEEGSRLTGLVTTPHTPETARPDPPKSVK